MKVSLHFPAWGDMLAFAHTWKSCIPKAWEQEVGSQGYKFKLCSQPLLHFRTSNLPWFPQCLVNIHHVYSGLLGHGVAIRDPAAGHLQGFYSNLFTVPKPQSLNAYIYVQNLCIYEVFLASVDIKDTSIHVHIFPAHQHSLCFVVEPLLHQIMALSFDLSFAPQVLTNVWTH